MHFNNKIFAKIKAQKNSQKCFLCICHPLTSDFKNYEHLFGHEIKKNICFNEGLRRFQYGPPDNFFYRIGAFILNNLIMFLASFAKEFRSYP